MPLYTIQPGDHLSSIAHDSGFADFNSIWNDGQNAALKALRKDPSVLLAGDVIFIPDRKSKQVPGATDARHRFKMKKPRLLLRIILNDMAGKPLAGLDGRLEIEGTVFPVTSSGSGQIEHPIQPTDRNARIIFGDPPASFDAELLVQIGFLDPVDTASGQIARLANLGYFLGDPDKPEPDEIRSAIEEFQCDQKLTVDGICGPNTQAKLKSIHGS